MLLALPVAAVIGGAAWFWTPDKSRAELESRYLASPGDMRDVAGVRLHVRDTGPRDAPAVIMIHGFGASLHTWETWAKGLSGDFRVVRFDLPGSGLSGVDPGGDYTDGRSLQVLVALMDDLGIRRASLIGNSIGGRIAWKFAVQHPDRIDRLVRMVEPAQDALVVKWIGTIALGFHAHRRYLERHGTPGCLEDLLGHSLIGFDREAPAVRSLLKGKAPVFEQARFALRADSHLAQLAAIRAGFGIGVCQTGLAARDPDLVHVLPDAFELKLGTWLAMHENLKSTPGCRAAFDALASGLPEAITNVVSGFGAPVRRQILPTIPASPAC